MVRSQSSSSVLRVNSNPQALAAVARPATETADQSNSLSAASPDISATTAIRWATSQEIAHKHLRFAKEAAEGEGTVVALAPGFEKLLGAHEI